MDTINGYEIVAQVSTPADSGTRAGRVILVDRGESWQFDRYVISWQGRDDGVWDSSWHGGIYRCDRAEAFDYFIKRGRRLGQWSR